MSALSPSTMASWSNTSWSNASARGRSVPSGRGGQARGATGGARRANPTAAYLRPVRAATKRKILRPVRAATGRRVLRPVRAATRREAPLAGGRRGKERAASLRAQQRLAAGGRRLPRPGRVRSALLRRLPRPGRVRSALLRRLPRPVQVHDAVPYSTRTPEYFAADGDERHHVCLAASGAEQSVCDRRGPEPISRRRRAIAG